MVDFTSEGLASIWVGQQRHGPGIDILRDLCGVDYYDVDFQECIIGKGWNVVPLAGLLRRLSFADSFLDDALRVAAERGISEALWVVMQLDFEYDPARVARLVAPDPVFLGAFPWHG